MHVLRDVMADRITVNEAAQLMRITCRQVFRLLKAHRAHGPKALVDLFRKTGQHSMKQEDLDAPNT
jgi:hypothetical protein